GGTKAVVTSERIADTNNHGAAFYSVPQVHFQAYPSRSDCVF
ncbi:MAG: hypothetical protein H6Q64_505, partial [Firmicutes bacterium]|nr:hypothetical protein [Bacillota bacterium]